MCVPSLVAAHPSLATNEVEASGSATEVVGGDGVDWDWVGGSGGSQGGRAQRLPAPSHNIAQA